MKFLFLFAVLFLTLAYCYAEDAKIDDCTNCVKNAAICKVAKGVNGDGLLLGSISVVLNVLLGEKPLKPLVEIVESCFC